mgnify:CR=1 FL=1
MKVQHRPGPWVPIYWGKTISIDAPNYCGVAFINPRGDSDSGTPSQQDRANARLISAAPELLQACRNLLRVVVVEEELSPEDMAVIIRHAADTVRKAEGGEV